MWGRGKERQYSWSSHTTEQNSMSRISSKAASMHVLSRHAECAGHGQPPADSSTDAVPYSCMSLTSWILMLSTVPKCDPGHAGAAGSPAHLPRDVQHCGPSKNTVHNICQHLNCVTDVAQNDDPKLSSLSQNHS